MAAWPGARRYGQDEHAGKRPAGLRPRPLLGALGRVASIAVLALLGFAAAGLAQSGGAPTAPASAPPEVRRGEVTNLPLPRFVSLKGREGNARRGPGLDHRIDWVFRHPGLPLKITAEYGNWRRVEDVDGMGGWVHYALLSGVRTVIVTAPDAVLRRAPRADAPLVARAEAEAILDLESCNADWCQLEAQGVEGWLPRSDLWGVLPDETVD